MDGPTIGSLFTGAGALCELALAPLVDGRVIWHCEYEPPTEKRPRPTQAAAKLLAHRFPGTPNLGDITQVDWTSVRRPRVLAGGFPCTDVSLAGKQIGLVPGNRSGTWTYMAYAINTLRPDLVVIENVRGLASTAAHSDVEPCPWCVGDRPSQPVLRALGAVLGDLADLGYDTAWCGLRASDVGACHERFRLVLVAAPNTLDHRHGWAGPARRGGLGPAVGGGEPERRTTNVTLLPTPRATDGEKGGPNQRGSSGDLMLPSLVAQLLPTPSVAYAEGSMKTRGGIRNGELLLNGIAEDVVSNVGTVDWGVYAAAVRRHERWLGRSVPFPRTTGARGGPKLNPALTEWMMGWPQGWVTDVPGLTIDDQLRVCGNGVVPQQIRAALHDLIPMVR